jgi:hypothetical protein
MKGTQGSKSDLASGAAQANGEHAMTWRRILILVCLLGVASVGAEAADAKTPAARCAELYDLYYHYVDDANHHHDGERQQAEYAKYRCAQGNTAEGLPTLEAILTRNLVAYPKE